MSRIDDALRRALQEREIPTAILEPEPEHFVSPWALDAERDAGRLPPGAPKPADHALSLLSSPQSTAVSGIEGFSSRWKERLVVSRAADWVLVEQFRRLAATLHQAQSAGNIKTVMVTSATPGDGKTLTAINLALILGESYGRRVLLIDADLRRPSIRDVSHAPDVVGLSDGLKAKTEQRLTVMQITRNLTLLPAGRPDPDPMSGLTSPRMRRILDDAADRFDWVILDAPPVGTVADGSLLAGMVDGALLVVRAGHTQCPMAIKAIEAIGRERILGVVLNAMRPSDQSAYAAYAGAYSEARPTEK
jgi:capsular exopolysaccharide synthesis family protein